MEYRNPKIKFYKQRTFGEKLNISFDYIRETWKPMLKFSLYLILPICLIQAFAMNAYVKSAFSFGMMMNISEEINLQLFTFIFYCLLLILCYLIGSAILSSLVYTFLQKYETRQNRLLDITFADFRSTFIKNIWTCIRISLFFIVVILVISGLITLLVLVTPWTLTVSLPLFCIGIIIFSIPIVYLIPIYIFEELSFFAALRKTLKYGFSTWGETFLIIIVFGLLGSIINGVTYLPWYLVLMFGQLFTTIQPDSFVASPIYSFIEYLLGIIQSYGMYIAMILSSIGIAFQYFSLREKKEAVSVEDSIANFDKL